MVSDKALPAQEIGTRVHAGWIALFALVMGLVIFRSFLSVQSIHFTTDDNIGALSPSKRMLPRGFLSGWGDHQLVGCSQHIDPSWTILLFWLLPLPVFVNYVHPLTLLLGSALFGLFLRRRHCRLPAILRIAERYDPHWQAWIDGRPTPIVRADYLFQALSVEAGVHDVVLKYRAPLFSFWVLMAGLLVCLGALLALAFRPQG